MSLTENQSSVMDSQSVPSSISWKRLEDETFPKILFRLYQTNETGLLYLSRAENRISLVIYQGSPVFASSNSFEDSLGQMLVGKGILSRVQLMDTVKAAQRESKRLGMVLVQRGIISTDDLKTFIKDQIRTIIFKVFAWEKGFFHFDPQNLGQRQTIHFEETTLGLILGGIRAQVSLKRLLSMGVKPQTVLEHRRSADDTIYREYAWPPAIEQILNLVDGHRKVQEILEASGLESQEALGAIWMLLVVERLAIFGQDNQAASVQMPMLASPFQESVPLPANGALNLSPPQTTPSSEITAWKDFSLTGEFDQNKRAIAQALWESEFTVDPDAPASGKKRSRAVDEPSTNDTPRILGDLEALEKAYEMKRSGRTAGGSGLSPETEEEDIFNEITLDEFPAPPAVDPGEITLEPLSEADRAALKPPSVETENLSLESEKKDLVDSIQTYLHHQTTPEGVAPSPSSDQNFFNKMRKWAEQKWRR